MNVFLAGVEVRDRSSRRYSKCSCPWFCPSSIFHDLAVAVFPKRSTTCTAALAPPLHTNSKLDSSRCHLMPGQILCKTYRHVCLSQIFGDDSTKFAAPFAEVSMSIGAFSTEALDLTDISRNGSHHRAFNKRLCLDFLCVHFLEAGVTWYYVLLVFVRLSLFILFNPTTAALSPLQKF